MTRNLALKYGGGIAAIVTSASSFAAGVDLTSLTAAVDLSTVVPAIVAVGALLMVPGVAKFAVASVRRMFPR